VCLQPSSHCRPAAINSQIEKSHQRRKARGVNRQIPRHSLKGREGSPTPYFTFPTKFPNRSKTRSRCFPKKSRKNIIISRLWAYARVVGCRTEQGQFLHCFLVTTLPSSLARTRAIRRLKFLYLLYVFLRHSFCPPTRSSQKRTSFVYIYLFAYLYSCQ
jgi:hypothetical protein